MEKHWQSIQEKLHILSGIRKDKGIKEEDDFQDNLSFPLKQNKTFTRILTIQL